MKAALGLHELQRLAVRRDVQGTLIAVGHHALLLLLTREHTGTADGQFQVWPTWA